MSLMGTLAKVAIGVALAKGAGKMMQGGAASQGTSSGGGLFGGASSQASQGGGLEDSLRGMLGGGNQQAGAGTGGLGGLLESLAGGQTGSQQAGAPSGGLNDLLGGLTGGTGAAGGLGGLLGGLMGAATSGAGSASGGFGDMLNQALANNVEPEATPSQEQEVAAGLMLSAMIQAAKSDGNIDAAEEQKLLGRLGDVSDEERAFVQAEMQKPVDVDALARDVPRGLEAQVYAMSVMGIDLDSQAEAQYLHALAGALCVDQSSVNDIHAQLGVQPLYS